MTFLEKIATLYELAFIWAHEMMVCLQCKHRARRKWCIYSSESHSGYKCKKCMSSYLITEKDFEKRQDLYQRKMNKISSNPYQNSVAESELVIDSQMQELLDSINIPDKYA